MSEYSRVKRCDAADNHAIPSVSIERMAERGANIQPFGRNLTAKLPQEIV